MPSTILNVAYPLVPFGPNTAGDVEQIRAALDREIVRAGHHSLVLAARGFRPGSLLLPVALTSFLSTARLSRGSAGLPALPAPPVSFPSGALPEILEHGRTGDFLKNVSAMAEAIGAAEGPRAEDRLPAARKRFSLSRMRGGYFRVYSENGGVVRPSGAAVS